MVTKIVAIVRTTVDVVKLYVDEIRQILQNQSPPSVQNKNPNFYKKNNIMIDPSEQPIPPSDQNFDYTDDGDYVSDRIVFMHNFQTNDTLPIRFSGDEWKMVHEIAEQSGENPKDVLQDIVLNRLEILAESFYNEIDKEFPE